MSGHGALYRAAEYYDIAFDFRDIPRECDFLAACGAAPVDFPERPNPR